MVRMLERQAIRSAVLDHDRKLHCSLGDAFIGKCSIKAGMPQGVAWEHYLSHRYCLDVFKWSLWRYHFFLWFLVYFSVHG